MRRSLGQPTKRLGNDEHLTFTMNMRGTLAHTHTLVRTLVHALAAAYHGSGSSRA